MLRTRLIAGRTAGLVVSAIFATVLCVANLFETFVEPLRVVPEKPAPVTLRLPTTTVQTNHDVGVTLTTQARVVSRGERTAADPELAALVRSHENARRPPDPSTVLGLWFVYFLIGVMLTSYLRTFSPGRGSLLRTQAGLMGLSALWLLLCKALLLLTDVSAFVLPIPCIGLWAALYLDRRTAFVIVVALSFLASSLVGFRLVALAVYAVSGTVAVAAFRDRKHTTRMMGAGFVAGLGAAAMVVAGRTVVEGTFDPVADIMGLWRSDIIGGFAGGLSGGLLAYAFQGIAVVALGAVSRQKLLDLSDLGQPLLQKMADEAPGSWEHARAMANLA
ncbi:MAG: hypothetical protein AAGF12_22625, partial [Myxococcota bacterium]